MSVADAALAPSAASVRPRRFVILDDHPLVIEAVAARVRLVRPDAVIAYAGPSMRDAVRCVATDGCDCAIVDLELGDGTSAAHLVSAFAMHGVPTIALTERAAAEHLESCLAAGARAYVDKRSEPRGICEAITAVLAGRTWLPDGVLRRPLPGETKVALSAQERRALVLYTSGMTQDMVARRMGIAASTVKHYLDRVREKYDAAGYPARTKLELHARARADGLLP